MVNFSFPQRNPEEQGIPGEEGPEVGTHDTDDGGRGSSRRLLIIAAIGVVLIGGWYLANQLFLAPSPPALTRSAVPGPQPPAATAPPSTAPVPAGPAQPPSKEEVKATATTSPAKAPKPTAPSPGPAPGKAEAGKAAVPVKVGAKPATRSVQTSPPKFSLQMGAMVMEENAEALKQKLDASGFPAVIRKGTAFVSKQVVTVGEPSSKSAAEDLSRRLNVDGFPSEPLDVGGKYTPQIGAFFNLDEAVDLARELQKKNYHPKITSKPVTTVVYQVRHGMFDSRNAAMVRGEELKSKGFNSLVVRE